MFHKTKITMINSRRGGNNVCLPMLLHGEKLEDPYVTYWRDRTLQIAVTFWRASRDQVGCSTSFLTFASIAATQQSLELSGLVQKVSFDES